MPTAWTEKSASCAWQEGRIAPDDSDYFIDFLFESVGFWPVLAWSGSEVSVAATSYAEKSVSVTTWVEVSP